MLGLLGHRPFCSLSLSLVGMGACSRGIFHCNAKQCEAKLGRGLFEAMLSIAGLSEDVVTELCKRSLQATHAEGGVCQIAKLLRSCTTCQHDAVFPVT